MFDSLEDKMRKLNSAGPLGTLRIVGQGLPLFLFVTDRPIGVPAGQAAYTWEAWIQYVEILDENPSGRSAGTCAVTVALCFA
jgi:hypothetical protein